MQHNAPGTRPPRATSTINERPSSEAFRPKFGWKFSDAGRFWLWVIGAVLALTHSTAFADTTWVSGAVSGEWTREGNPYIVVDSTKVPEREFLRICEGVEVYFNSGQGLYCFGLLEAIGTEEDSVIFRVSNGVEHFGGIRLLSRSRYRFEFTSIQCPDTAFVPVLGALLSMQNSRVNALSAVIAQISRGIAGQTSWDLSFMNCHLLSPAPIDYDSGLLNATNTRFETGSVDGSNGAAIILNEGMIALDSCIVIGSCVAGQCVQTTYDDCYFLKKAEESESWVNVSGIDSYMANCYVEGGVSGDNAWNPRVFTISNSIILASVAISNVGIEVTNCQVLGNISASEGEMNLSYSTIYGGVGLNRVSRGTIYYCTIGNRSLPSRLRCWGDIRLAGTVLRLARCFVMEENLGISGFDSLSVTNCTFITDSTRFYYIDMAGQYADSVERECKIVNNIFFATHPVESLVRFSDLNLLTAFQYNSVYGFEAVVSHEAELNLGNTNITVDPMLTWQDSVLLQTSNSVCIDAGDPDSPPDPDGSRADIGAFYFPQPNLALETRIVEFEVGGQYLSDTLSIEMSNSGIELLYISLDGNSIDAPFRLLNLPDDTLALGSMETFSLLVETNPEEVGTYVDTLLVYSSDRDEPVVKVLLISRDQRNGLVNQPDIPQLLILPPYPNPCNSSVFLEFSLQAKGEVGVRIYDLAGRLVKEFSLALVSSGRHRIEYDTQGIATGLYLVEAVNGAQRERFKLFVMK